VLEYNFTKTIKKAKTISFGFFYMNSFKLLGFKRNLEVLSSVEGFFELPNHSYGRKKRQKQS